MVTSASVSCRGSPCSTSASGNTSRASPCRAAELTGHSHGREGWGCEWRPSLACLRPSRPDQRHPVKAGACRATASRLAALTGSRRPGRGLAKQVRLDRKRSASDSGKGIPFLRTPARNVLGHCVQRAEIASSKYLCAPLRRPDVLTFALRFLFVFRSIDLTREPRNGGRRGKEKALSDQ